MKEGYNTGLQALLAVSGLTPDSISAGRIAFTAAPRLNAAGRISHAEKGVRLLLETDQEKAGRIAEELNELNKERQDIEHDIARQAVQQIEAEKRRDDGVLVAYGQDWHAGVIGIAASRLVEEYYRPSLVISVHDGVGKGSCRSIAGFNMYEALQYADDLNELFLQSGDEVFWMGCTDHVAATVSLGGAQGDGWINLCVVLPPDETGSWASYATNAACWDKDSIALYSGQPSAGQKYILPYQIFDWDIVEEAGGDKTRLDLTLVYQARSGENDVIDFIPGETVSFYPLPQILPPAEVDPDRDITLALNNGSSAPSTRTFTALAKLYWQRRQTPDPETADLSGLLAQYRGSTIVETFIGNGLEPSLEHRAALAEAAGIPGYTGTDDQDARLMQALGAPETPTGLG